MSASPEAPTFQPTDGRRRVSDVVPVDALHAVRLTFMGIYLVAYLWWLKYMGLPIDRISVAISVGIFLVAAFVGRSWRTWGVLLIDCIFYIVMWTSYERTRDYGDNGFEVFGLFKVGPFPLQVDTMREIDRAMFFGHDPNVVLQRFWQRDIRWWDYIASTTYMTHFVFPIIAMAVLWYLSHRQWTRFMKRFATLLMVACAMFILLPTVPPWMAGDPRYNYEIIPELTRGAGRGFRDLGFKGFTHDYNVQLSKGNAVAAMPSLHASFALIVPLFFMQWIRRRWVKWALWLFPITMLTSLVYLAEHWVIDGLVGWAITVGGFWFWDRREQQVRDRRTARALADLPVTTNQTVPAGYVPYEAGRA
ncbi:MAG TPA: hypothetical protein DCR14_16565 [Acidimicrobiaceae bacterium]|nr:hypothetical protein [Acidimicrobiaceae bacterium]